MNTQPRTEAHQKLIEFIITEYWAARREVTQAAEALERAQQDLAEAQQDLMKVPMYEDFAGISHEQLAGLAEDAGLVVPDELLFDGEVAVAQ
jgi:hypothetical protein